MDADSAKKIFRPTEAQRVPYVSLPKAIERAKELYRIAQTFEVPVATAAKTWGYAEKSSGGAQTVAALKTFGLLEDNGSGAGRKVKLSEWALKIIRDPREISPERDSLIRQAAMRPAGHRAVIEQFGGGLPPSDEALKAHLMMDLQLRDGAVDDFIREFSETMAFAKIGSADIITDSGKVTSGITRKPIPVGALVQWEPGGVLQFDRPQRVMSLSEDGGFLFVEGSNTGLPVDEVRMIEQPSEHSGTQGAATRAAGSVAPVRARAPMRPGTERAEFPLKDGIAMIEMPSEFSPEGYEDFETWLQLVLRKAKRSIKEPE